MTKSYYFTNPARKEQLRAKTREYRDRNRKHVYEFLKLHPCISCGEPDPVVLEFDHKEPALKHDAVADMIFRNASIKRLQAEMDKCDVLCANCHRRKTAKQLNYWVQNAQR